MGVAERNGLRSCARLTRGHKITIALLTILFIIYHSTPYDSRPRSFALSNETFFSDTIVVQDFPVVEESQKNYSLANGKAVPAIDIIGWNLKRGALNGTQNLERMRKYKHLADAVGAEEWMLADGIGRNMGWELDAMKFLPSLEYAWLNMPKKKWYLVLDDDTYIIKHSLTLLLGHLNPAKPTFLGNPVGDYKGRFPHGGSSVIISGSAVSKLYDGHPDIVAEGHQESPTAIWGDKLLSTTFMKIGVYLDETYGRMFNGENPWMTRMWVDRFCLPLVSFHGLGEGDLMEQVGNTFKHMEGPVFWRQLADIYGTYNFSSFHQDPVRANMDFVGRLDEHSTTFTDVNDVPQCIKLCGQHRNTCLAWTFDPALRLCHIAPWAIIGEIAEGRSSGVNAPLAEWVANKCHTPS
ncbi:hypothetical protein DL766_002537 [Monosporascus sp. MC13-8B]|uniref:N-acetylgalactosaminide beta-1,3-galactosyltransferase n=1 Tax=Monosporascus cannonballus TaxID=155416 RepID=A0ABY0GWG4_9PEZI|nr:hypothetical protein DL762_009988 [Monosporascus cannonballus]RYP01041.1 hypothetical protein DL763_000462 [Monosporascus cannonballus]RYP35361.1 hypothetical protein DL766_002537 [Monosporascus sp. MC13-8B]